MVGSSVLGAKELLRKLVNDQDEDMRRLEEHNALLTLYHNRIERRNKQMLDIVSKLKTKPKSSDGTQADSIPS